MKTILYALIASFILGLFSTGFISSVNSPTETIVLQSKDKNLPVDYLYQSVDIIKNRLEDFSSEKFEISLIREKNQIVVSFYNNLDINTITNLLVQKGELSFHEVYDQYSVQEIVNDDDHLFSLFKTANTNEYDAMIGCASVSEVDAINDYISTMVLSQNLKFVWSKLSNNSEACLYAIKLSENKEEFITEADIKSIKSSQDKESTNFQIEVKFKEAAVDKWAEVTGNSMNKNIAIVLDNTLICSPVIRSEIKSGVFTITGNFSETETKFIASLGSNGVLPVDFEVAK